MFNLMVVVINKQINKVFYCFDPNTIAKSKNSRPKNKMCH